MEKPTPELKPEPQAWELELRRRFRAFQTRAAGALTLFALCAGVFIIALQALLSAGPKPIVFWGPFAFYLPLGLAFASRGRWLYAGICFLWLFAAAWQLTAAAGIRRAPTRAAVND